jgi:hypothetical protein
MMRNKTKKTKKNKKKQKKNCSGCLVWFARAPDIAKVLNKSETGRSMVHTGPVLQKFV